MTRFGKIVDRMLARVALIRIANGYQTDAGLKTILIDCETDPDKPQADDDGPFDSGLVIQIQPAEPVDQVGNVQLGGQCFAEYRQQVSIFGYLVMQDRANWFHDGQKLEADIKRALFGELEDRRYYKDTGLKEITLATATARTPGYGDQYLGVEVAIELLYIENLSNPWEPDD